MGRRRKPKWKPTLYIEKKEYRGSGFYGGEYAVITRSSTHKGRSVQIVKINREDEK